jgi:hypothetical protein
MFKLKLLPIVLALLFLSGCAYHSGLTNNFNNNNTNVELNQKNYKIVDYVKGDANCTYIFGIGGLSKDALVEKARSEMYRNAQLKGEARAITNIAVDTKYSIFPIIRRMTVTVSGHVVEFNK